MIHTVPSPSKASKDLSLERFIRKEPEISYSEVALNNPQILIDAPAKRETEPDYGQHTIGEYEN